MNLQILGSNAVATHASGHAGALEDATRGCAGTDATDAAVCCLVTVGCALAGKAVAFHTTGEALTLGSTGDVHEVNAFENLNGDVLSNLVTRDVVHANLGHVAAGGNASFLEVTCLRLLSLAGVNLAIGDLDGVVAIVFYGANLGNHTRPSFDDGNRNNAVGFVEDLSHAELGAQNALDLSFTH